MSNEALQDLENVVPENRDNDQELSAHLNVLKLSNPSVLDSIPPCIAPPTKPTDSREHARDSGYGSLNSTPNHNKDATIPSRKPGQESFIRQTGFCISNKAMEAGTKRRFLEVQLQLEKMLLEYVREFKLGPGRYKTIAIRPMMLGRTEADADAKPYMVVICSESMKRKVQIFFDDPLVKAMCDPGDDNITPFKALVIGHELRLRASASDITVHCDARKGFHNDTKTFCGMPICLCDEFGHSRCATFGGIIKATFTSGEYQLYGLTAGHMINNNQLLADEDDESLLDLESGDLLGLNLNKEVMEAPRAQTRTASPTRSNSMDKDDLDSWYFSGKLNIGKVLNATEYRTLSDGGENQVKPHLDWALFELNTHKPNRIGFHSQGSSRGDLELPVPTTDPSKDEVYVSMLCASHGAKHGVLSTTKARVLLNGADSFTDAYTLSLEGSEVSDGDSGSWVVDELRLEVYGHVVADDFFGDVYVIPMTDILADIKRCLGARSVDLPSGLDIMSKASLQQPGLFARPKPRPKPRRGLYEHSLTENPEDTFHLQSTGQDYFMLNDEGRAVGSIGPAGSWHRPLSISSSTDTPRRAVSIRPTDVMIIYPEHVRRPQPTDSINPNILVNVEWPPVMHDSGYSSLDETPNTSPPPQAPPPQAPPRALEDRYTCKNLNTRVMIALEADDSGAWEQLSEDERVEAFWSLSEKGMSSSDL